MGIEQIDVVVDNIRFRNAENGYSVLNVSREKERPNGRSVWIDFTAVGKVFDVYENGSYRLTGTWVMDPRYGEQFAFSSCEHLMDNSSSDVFAFLTSKNVKGCGPVLARRIIKTFGKDTVDVLDNHPERLSEVSGIKIEELK